MDIPGPLGGAVSAAASASSGPSASSAIARPVRKIGPLARTGVARRDRPHGGRTPGRGGGVDLVAGWAPAPPRARPTARDRAGGAVQRRVGRSPKTPKGPKYTEAAAPTISPGAHPPG